MDEVIFTKAITVHRMKIYDELIEIFMQQDILNYELNVTVLDVKGRPESGMGAGVMKDVISLFYEELKNSNLHGGNYMVPVPRHNCSRSQWMSIARIIVYGIKRLEYMPLFLSKCFFAYTLFGEENLKPETLISGLLEFVSLEEKDILEKARKDFEIVDKDELLDVLSGYKCFSNPTSGTIDTILAELAHLHLIQAPKYISTAFQEIFSKHKLFSSYEVLNDTYKLKLPTPRKLTKVLKFPDVMSAQEQEISTFLINFTKSLQQDHLFKFLRFVTGSDNLPDVLNINFTKQSYRAPVARVCANLLEVDDSYSCYNEISEEIMNILKNPECWRFAFI